MSTDTKLPHCPRCGHAMVTHIERETAFVPCCAPCGFGDPGRFGYWGHEDDTRRAAMADAAAFARRVIRAELARQALEMRAHSQAQAVEHTYSDVYRLKDNMTIIMDDYRWLGQNPIRLPGEDS